MTAAAERAAGGPVAAWERAKRFQHLVPELIVGCATILAAGLALYQLDGRSFWLDEATSYYVSSVSWSRLLEVVSGDASGWHPPTYFVALKAWRVFGGDSQVALRSFSVVFAVLTIPMVYVLARRFVSRWGAAVASLLLACNAYFVQYAQEARTYALTMFLATASYVLFLWAAEAESRRRWLAYAAVTLLGIYSHIFFTLVVAAQALSLVVPALRPRRVDGPLIAFGVIGLLTLPLFVASLGRSGSLLDWVNPIDWATLSGLFTSYAGGTETLLVAYGTASLLAITWAVGPGRRPSWIWLLLLWVLVPPLGLAAASLVKPLFVNRYVIVSLPALVILVAIGITRLPHWAATVVIVIVLIASSIGVSGWYARPSKEWDAAVAHIQSRARRADAVAIWRAPWFKPLAYQVTRLPKGERRPTLASPPRPWGHNPYGRGRASTTAAAERLRECQFRRIWLVGAPRRFRGASGAEQERLTTILRGAYRQRDVVNLGGLRLQLFVRNDEPCPTTAAQPTSGPVGLAWASA